MVLVEPQYEGNVGAVARVCANFGVDDLVIVKGPELTDPARMMAVHAKSLLEQADEVESLAEALAGTELSLGFTAETATKPQDHLRDALALPEAAAPVHRMEGRTALVFGREDQGLSVEELKAVDLVAFIPVDPGYASMNLSHAVSVALYELSTRGRFRPLAPQGASRDELELLFAALEQMARAGGMRKHKVAPTMICLRRVFGRTRLSTWEYHRMMGVISKGLKSMGAWPIDVDEDEL